MATEQERFSAARKEQVKSSKEKYDKIISKYRKSKSSKSSKSSSSSSSDNDKPSVTGYTRTVEKTLPSGRVVQQRVSKDQYEQNIAGQYSKTMKMKFN